MKDISFVNLNAYDTDGSVVERTKALRVNGVLNTDAGFGREIRIHAMTMEFDHATGEGDFRVFYDAKNWNVAKHGLIQGDAKFLTELKQYLTAIDLDASDIEYPSENMQGKNYVSLAIGKSFKRSWWKLLKETKQLPDTHAWTKRKYERKVPVATQLAKRRATVAAKKAAAKKAAKKAIVATPEVK